MRDIHHGNVCVPNKNTSPVICIKLSGGLQNVIKNFHE